MKRGSLLSLVVSLACAGCWSPSVQYYSLQASPEASRFAGTSQGPVIEVRRLRLPGYLNNPQMVTRLDGGEVRLDESNRWIEDLGANFQRAFVQNLAARSGSTAVFISGYSDQTPERVVEVDIARFDVSKSGLANLTASYTISRPTKANAKTSVVTVLEEPVAGRGAEARVAALSELIDRLSKEIARAASR